MSLTKEEMEFVNLIEGRAKRYYELEPRDTLEIISIVRRLSARVEYLEEAFEASGNQTADAKNNLSALLSAVEPIARYNITMPDPENKGATFMSVPTSLIRNLSTIAAGIREGKG